MQKLSDLTPNARNPRKSTPEKLKMLRESVDEFGSLDGFVFNRRTQNLISGHQRRSQFPDAVLTIDKTYDIPTKVGTVAEGYATIEGERFQYRVVDWDLPREKAGMIAANKNAGSWDFPELSNLFTELDELNFDLDKTMFDQGERENIVAPEFIEPEPKKDPVLRDSELTTCPNCGVEISSG